MTTRLPTNFRRIRLELAREPGHPEGASDTGYTLVAPLDREGRLDADAWRDHKEACRVVKFGGGGENETGFLRRRPGGSWAFHYDLADGGADDDPGYRLGAHRFVLGEYVTILDDDGAHTFRVVSVQSV
ncbi:MAG: hypothetical protein AB7Q23_07240 [Hyphomonadaceae bacterium]